MRQTYHESEPAPVAGMLADLNGLNQQIIQMQGDTTEMLIRGLALQARVNRTLGRVSDTAQQVELQAHGKRKDAATSREEMTA